MANKNDKFLATIIKKTKHTFKNPKYGRVDIIIRLVILSIIRGVCACEVTQLCPTLCDPMDCSPPGSCVHGILQARILEWVAVSSSRGSSPPRDGT